MNTSRKNHDIFSCQDAPTPRYEVGVITLKSVLLYFLKRFLVSQYKEEGDSFIDFSQNRKTHSLSEIAAIANSVLSGREVPLQKQQSCTEVLYATALPQLFQKDLRPQKYLEYGNRAIPKEACYFTTRLKVFQLKPPSNDSLSSAETLSVLSNLWKSFKIENERPGWISFRLSNQGIYTWINQLQSISQMAEKDHTLFIKKLPLEPVKNELSLRSVNQKHQMYVKAQANQLIWQAQYTHARCCALLRSGEAMRAHQKCLWVQDENVSQKGYVLMLESIFSQNQSTPTRQLIQALIETADDMFWLPERYPAKQYVLLMKRAEQLSHAFDLFHRSNALIPGALQPFPYLTLVDSTRNLLKLLLQGYLEVSAPSAL